MFTNVTALAVYSGTASNNTLNETNQLEPLVYKAFMHKGIILNIEDFGGTVELTESTISKNINYMSEASV